MPCAAPRKPAAGFAKALGLNQVTLDLLASCEAGSWADLLFHSCKATAGTRGQT